MPNEKVTPDLKQTLPDGSLFFPLQKREATQVTCMSRRDCIVFTETNLLGKWDDCPEVSRRLFWGSKYVGRISTRDQSGAQNEFYGTSCVVGLAEPSGGWTVGRYMALDGGSEQAFDRA